MIQAIFSENQNRTATVNGAVQYDKGQQLWVYGIPSPESLADDDALKTITNGEISEAGGIFIQAQYAYRGDESTSAVLMEWDSTNEVWYGAVPDAYLKYSKAVIIYLRVGYNTGAETGDSNVI